MSGLNEHPLDNVNEKNKNLRLEIVYKLQKMSNSELLSCTISSAEGAIIATDDSAYIWEEESRLELERRLSNWL